MAAGTTTEVFPCYGHEPAFLLHARLCALQLERVIQYLGYKDSPSLHDVLTLHRLSHHVLTVKVGASTSTDQDSFRTKCDRFWMDFQRVNELASELLQSLKQQNASNPFFQTQHGSHNSPLFLRILLP